MPGHGTPQTHEQSLLATEQPEPLLSIVEGGARRALACERCFKRKQRCDRILPVCTPCRRSASACTGSEREDAVLQSGDKGVVRKGFVTTLLERIAKLEEQATLTGTEEVITADFAGAPASGSEPRSGNGEPSVAPPPHEPLGTSMNMSLLSLNAMAEPHNRQGEFLKHLSISRIIAGVTETYGGNPEAASRVDSLWEGISTYIRHPLAATHRLHVAREEAVKALKTYLEVVDFRFPRLPVQKVEAGIDAISAPNDTKYRKMLAEDPAHIFMAYAVIAIVPLVSDSYPISQGSWISVHLLGKCLKVLDRVFHKEDGVDIIQCLQLLVILSIHCSAAGSAWHLVGFAMNKCIALGYHREDRTVAASVSYTELQQRRWAFWGCCHLDRLICAALGRPSSVDEKYISVPVPDIGGERVQADAAPCISTGTKRDFREEFNVHLFRYSSILALVINENVDPTLTAQSYDSEFEYFLSQALQWRMTAPPRDDPSVQHVHRFQISLYNTLLLRMAVREILRDFVFDDSLASDFQVQRVRFHLHADPSASYSMFKDCISNERVKIRRIKLPSICQAVAQSLDRARMASRPYLSLLTGYSALTMGLATLYCSAVDARAENLVASTAAGQPFSSSAHLTPSSLATTSSSNQGRYTSLPREARVSNSATCGPFENASFNSPQQRGSKAATEQGVREKTYNTKDVLDLCIQKLEVVGRQFPRLLQYKSVVQGIRSLVNGKLQREMCNLEEEATPDELENLVMEARDISPLHLRRLSETILYMVTENLAA